MRRGRTKSCKSCRLFRFQRLKTILFAPLLDVETGAGTVGVFVVSVDGDDGMLLHQVLHQLEQGEALERGTGVGRTTVGIEAADIGDADALGVVAFGMCARLLDRSACVDAAVGVDDIMIADVAPAEGTVVAADALHRADGIGARGGAMNDDFGDWAHFFVSLMGLMGLMGVFGLRRCSLHKVAGHTSSILDNRWNRGDRYDRVLERGRGWVLGAPSRWLVIRRR